MDVIHHFAYDLPIMWRTEPKFKEMAIEAYGKTLGCFCNTDVELCHGMVIQIFVHHFLHGNIDQAIESILPFINMETEDDEMKVIDYYNQFKKKVK